MQRSWLRHCLTAEKTVPGRVSSGSRQEAAVLQVTTAIKVGGVSESLSAPADSQQPESPAPCTPPAKTRMQCSTAADALLMLQKASGAHQEPRQETMVVDSPSPVSVCSTVAASPAASLLCAASSSTGHNALPLEQVLGQFVRKIYAMWKTHLCEHMTPSPMRHGCLMLCNSSTVTTCTAHALAHVHIPLVPTGACSCCVHRLDKQRSHLQSGGCGGEAETHRWRFWFCSMHLA